MEELEMIARYEDGFDGDVTELVKKLTEVMSEIDHVDKRGRNEFARYAYMKATDLAHAVRGPLAERGVFAAVSVIARENYEVAAKDGGIMQFTDVVLRVTFMDGKGRIWVNSVGTGGDKGDKASYKAITGALKYALRNAFLVPDESDPEADEKTDRAFEKKSRAAAEQDIAKLKPSTEPNRGHGNEAPAQLTTPTAQERVAASIPGVSVGAKASTVEGQFVRFTTKTNTKNQQYLIVDMGLESPLYVWDTKLFEYIARAKPGMSCGFECATLNNKTKIVSILWIGQQEFRDNLPWVEGGIE